MILLIVSFLAGVLTIAAPCILPLLPIIVGGSIVRSGNTTKEQQKFWWRPAIIASSLAFSVVLFTLLLKFSTSLLGVPQQVWQIIAGAIVCFLGMQFIWPQIWEKLPLINQLNLKSNRLLGKSIIHKGFFGDVLIGFSLGPVFSSCSPTYALIVATVLPVSFSEGILYLLAYAIGLAVTLLAVAYLGQSLVARLGWLSNPHSKFKKIVGVLFIATGLIVGLGIDKNVQTFVLDKGWYAPIEHLENSLR